MRPDRRRRTGSRGGAARAAGFTLFELIVVVTMVALGAALLAERVVTLRAHALAARVTDVAAAYFAGATLLRATLRAGGARAVPPDVAVAAGPSGWPSGPSGRITRIEDCLRLWHAVLDPVARPALQRADLEPGRDSGPASGVAADAGGGPGRNAGPGAEFEALLVTDPADPAGTAGCAYRLQARGNADPATVAHQFSYAPDAADPQRLFRVGRGD